MPVRLNGATSGYVEVAAPDTASNATITLPNTSATLANTAQLGVGKNRIINGGFDVNQRGFTSVTANATYTFDRFKTGCVGGTTTYTPQTFTLGDAPVAGYEATNYLRIVTAGQSAAGDYAYIRQDIENVRTFANQTVTVSFWAKAASGTPNVGVTLTQSFGSGGSASSTVVIASPAVKAISTSWTRYSFTISVPSISGKTLGTNNDHSLGLHIFTSCGSTISNLGYAATGVQNGTFEFWGVQVEAGYSATPFEVEPYAETLRKCQRYYLKITGATNSNFAVGYWYGSTAYCMVPIQTPLRKTLTTSDLAYSSLAIDRPGTSGAAVSGIAFRGQTNTSLAVDFTSGITYTNNQVTFIFPSADGGYVTANAEL